MEQLPFGHPKIFISWSGDASKLVAEKLKEWLPCVIDAIQIWISSRDIPDGKRWSNELFGQLESCHLGILVLTAENIASQWINFEAGALSKDTKVGCVLPYLVGITPESLEGPLAQFQSINADSIGTQRLIESIISTTANPLSESVYQKRLQLFWPELESTIHEAKSISIAPANISSEDRISELQLQLDEAVNMIQQLVKVWSPPEPTNENKQSTLSTDHDLKILAGNWIDTFQGTHIYAKFIGERFYAPYCYGGNDELTAVFYDWKRLNSYYFARFQ